MYFICERYLEAKGRKCRMNTLDGYVSGLRCHVLPKWGARELESIKRREVQEWVDSIPTPGAAQKALKCLRQVIRWAIRTYDLEIFDATQGVELPERPVYRRESMDAREEATLLRAAVGQPWWAIRTYDLEIFDATQGVELPERPVYRRESMDAREEATLLRAAVGQPWEAVLLCAAALGLRPSEAAGLDWGDIDWRSGWVHIQRGAHSLQSGEVVEYACKTKLSDRFLKLPRFALERLRRIRGQRRKGRLRGDLSPRQIYTRVKRFLTRIGLGRCSMECLRHTWATLTIEGGAALADVSVALGHTDVSMCLQHYLMSTKAVVQRAQDAFAEVMRRGMEDVAMNQA